MKSLVNWLLIGALFVSGCSKEDPAPAPAPAPTGTSGTPGTDATPDDGANDSSDHSASQSTPKPAAKVSLPAAKNGLDLAYVTDDFTCAIIIHPARVLNSPLVKALEEAGLPLDNAIADVMRDIRMDPRTIEQVMILVDKDAAAMAPMMLMPFGPGPGPAFDDGPAPRFKEPLEKKEEPLEKGEFGASDQSDESLQFVNTTVLDEPGFDGPPLPTVIVRFTNSATPEERFEQIGAPPIQPEQKDGLTIYAIPDPDMPAVFHFPDAKTAIFTRQSRLKKLLGAQSADTNLTRQLKSVEATNDVILAFDLTPVKPMLTAFSTQMSKEVPPPFAGLAMLPSKAEGLIAAMGINGDNLFEVQVFTDNEQTAIEVNAAFTLGVQMMKGQYNANKQQMENSAWTGTPEMKAQAIAFSDKLINGISNAANGSTARVTIKNPGDLEALVALMQPAIEQAQRAAERAKKMNNLKQIGLGMHNFHDTWLGFPGAGSNFDGSKKGLSWRVHILPYVDQYDLYQQFNLDEPWDSENNKALIPFMPELYKVEGVEEDGKTTLHVFVGEQAFSADKGLGIRDITDGTSNTIMVVQAGPSTAEIWTKPGGLDGNADNPLETLGDIGEEFLALMMDGSVHVLLKAIAPETFKGLTTRNGGEVVNFGDF